MALVIALGTLLMAAGCDSEKIAKLEKQNRELQAEVSKSRTVADYDLQAKCSKDAKAWFNENWGSDKYTIVLHYQNHYNKSLNKCLILVEYHYWLIPYTAKHVGTWVNHMALWDVYDNVEQGTFSERHATYLVAEKVENSDEVGNCELLGKKCKTLQEFNQLVSPYLTN